MKRESERRKKEIREKQVKNLEEVDLVCRKKREKASNSRKTTEKRYGL